ncbi:unnamed protein product, partial [Bubo scandiacus]
MSVGIGRLNPAFGSSRSASSAYQKWPTEHSHSTARLHASEPAPLPIEKLSAFRHRPARAEGPGPLLKSGPFSRRTARRPPARPPPHARRGHATTASDGRASPRMTVPAHTRREGRKGGGQEGRNGYTPNGKGRGARAPHRPGEKQAPCSLRRRPRRPGSARPPHGGPRRARPRPACPPLARGVGGDGRHTGAARRPGSSGARPAGAARASALRTAGSPRAPTPARPAGNVRAAPPPHHTGPDGPATAGTRDGDAPPPGAPPDRRPATAPQRLPLPGTAAVASRLGPFRRHAPGERRTPLSRGRRPLSPLPRGERDGERPSAAHPPSPDRRRERRLRSDVQGPGRDGRAAGSGQPPADTPSGGGAAAVRARGCAAPFPG